MSVSVRQVLASPATLGSYLLLVVPFGLGWLETALMSPLALPGYLLFGIGTAIGNAIAPNVRFWVYWIPFIGGCAGIAAAVGFGYERWREASGSADRP